ncbi:uncharacterized protein C10orf120 homolog [Talpa occidentalis]|uniref:uncharacterized protein C10orf120 homolog n=1 Tax=Talpa occidentalis TaxID=50954 RepID=UPI00188F701A|nr:uncharacterized protein C10orf120 homolog [Talpa occidentalis]
MPILANSHTMIREWETFYQKTRKQEAKDQRAQGRSPEEESDKHRMSLKVLHASDNLQDRNLQCCQVGLCSASPLRIWSRQQKPDQHIALGKYSPLEKEILRLGGVHTIAARRFLKYKQEEERLMLKELRLLSSDYKRAMEYKRQHPPSCTCDGPLEKIWTAKVTVATEDFQMPPRERLTVSRHVERMQLARGLRSAHILPSMEKCRDPWPLPGESQRPEAQGHAREEEEGGDAAPVEEAKQEEEDQAEEESTERQNTNMKVIFKAGEPKKPLTCCLGDRRPFLPSKRERCITGLTNRNLLRVAEFPGDLMLMNQDLISQGSVPRDGAETCFLGMWRESLCRAASRDD